MKTNYTKLEEDLNKIKYKGIGIGSLLALELYYCYRGSYKKNGLKSFIKLIKSLVKAFLTKTPVFSNKSILYYKSADINHYEQIYNSFKSDEEKILLTGESKYAHVKSPVFKLDINDTKNLYRWSFRNYIKFKNTLNKNLLNKNELNLFIHLIISILRVNFWEDFYRLNNIKLLIGDYDRRNTSVPIYLISNKNNIPSVVIQHGAINSSHGFTPLIANYVFVWGSMQKNQFLELGVVNDRIFITGTPIVSEINKKIKEKNKIKKNVVLAINPLKEKFIKQQIIEFSQLNRENSYNLFIKIHPSQTIKNIKKIVKSINVDILPKKITFSDFVNMCDVLVTHSSGIANECILNDVPVIILDNLPISAGNGKELNKYCKVPLVNNVKQLNKQIKNLDTEIINKKDLYFKTGDEAKKLIYKVALNLYN